MISTSHMNPVKFILRSMSGLLGGFFGTLMLLLIFTLGAGILSSVLDTSEAATQAINPVFLAVFLIMVFTSLVIANLFSTLLISFCDRDKYTNRSTILHQIFIFNIILFFVSLPFYVFSLIMDFNTLSIIALLHSFLSLAGSHLILEGMASPKYSLMPIYATSFGVLLSVFSIVILYKIMGTINIVLFIFLPLTWFFMTLAQSIVELLYLSFYRFYGIDFLESTTTFGIDSEGREYISEDEEIEEEVEKSSKKPKDKTGAEFLDNK